MDKRTFRVQAVWDAEAGVFYSESDIVGLHIEASTLEEFEAAMEEHAVDLIVANHIGQRDLAEKPLASLIPAIFYKQDFHRTAAAKP